MKVTKISGGSGGRCGCGHHQRMGEVYYLIEDEQHRGATTYCQGCGKQAGYSDIPVTKIEDLEKGWFGTGEGIAKEVICRQLKSYVRERKSSSKKDAVLESAVEV